ncbi:MAG: chemotaxis protein CheD [Candidatus Margulisbacteria bacterium]|nr:chemotaxis protein CheD [Candidatus Margulisiibacteriota bacterium]
MAEIKVKLAEMRFSNKPDDSIVAHGLGACVALAIYDSTTYLGGLIHIVMPSSDVQSKNEYPIRFADTGIPLFLKEFMQQGGNFAACKIVISGGASMPSNSMFNIGDQNVVAVKKALSKFNLSVSSEDVGGNNGRTLNINIKKGIITSKVFGCPERVL